MVQPLPEEEGAVDLKCDENDLLGSGVLVLMMADLIRDVSADWSPSAINYLSILAHGMMLFERFEEKLAECRNPIFDKAYKADPPSSRRSKRVKLVTLALSEHNDECLRIMASEFEDDGADMSDYVYWGVLEPAHTQWKRFTRPSTDDRLHREAMW